MKKGHEKKINDSIKEIEKKNKKTKTCNMPRVVLRK